VGAAAAAREERVAQRGDRGVRDAAVDLGLVDGLLLIMMGL
jgi:hypothetical protein